jgi:hypothetical protein
VAASDDLRLAVVIEALLNSKGFEDAQAALKKTAAQAGAAVGPTKQAGDAAKKMGESFGGTRGPVADLTRILLQNAGVSGAAGEAAKAAGTAMYFMEGAATAASVATTGIIAAVAFGLPLLIKWMSSTQEQTKEQHDLRDSLESTSDLINRLIKEVPQLAAKYRETAEALHGASLDKQSDRLRELLNRQGELQKKIGETTSEWQKQNFEREINQLQAEVRLLMDAQRKNVTVTEMATTAIEAQTKANKDDKEAVESRMRAVVELDDILTRQSQEKLESIRNAQDFADQQEKDAEKDMKAQSFSDFAARRKKLQAEAEYQEQVARLKRQGIAIDADVAKLHRQYVLGGVADLGAAAGALSSFFGHNKALAIAGAIADTSAAAVGAAKDTPGPVWVRVAAIAAIVAAGMAQVQQIRKANPEGVGFDDPFADLTARKLGRRSAEDFARHFGATFVQMLPGEMQRQTVQNYHTTIDRSTRYDIGGVHGLVAGSPTAFARGLDRALNKTDRFRRRTTQGGNR